MISRFISSLQHPLVKKLVRLRENRAFRHQEGSVLIVGKTIAEEVAAHCILKNLISIEPLSTPAQNHHLATEEVLKKIIGHDTEDLVVAEVILPTYSDLQKARTLVVLDQIGDPGNVGTIFRTALALNWDGVFVIEGTADPYNDKALRASRGAPLRLPWRAGSWDDVQALLEAAPRQVVVADTIGTPISQMRFSKPLLLVLGHETRGPSPTAYSLGERITIPMKGSMESLNVASAAAILLYHIQEVSP